MWSRALLGLGALVVGAGCAVVQQGEVGVKRRFGVLEEKPRDPGLVFVNPLTTRVVKVPVRTINREVLLSLPSQEGLNITSEISILYRVKPEMAREVLANIGEDYENVVILSVFRSAAADVTARFMAKDMYTNERAAIEEEIASLMRKNLESRGFVIESVLLKSITLPDGLSRAIEAKLEADQEAQRMQFVLLREEQEAERKRIEAEGVRTSQRIIGENITPLLLQWKSIEAFRALASSPNAKIIVTDGQAPLLVDPGATPTP